ncbi:uncharacterized protein LOC131647224 [Vicia villosa]|uniref:uncharacterized protein LOC131647224 n=1 Tax=Vicia villosa TaxID=3911 RepID=UPI00273B8D76|nr:uncharacterized protein LOC131647224 [Vicia villosa]
MQLSILLTRMSSSEDKPINTRDFCHVYIRRRRRNITGASGKVVRDLDLNAPPPAEPASMPKTDGTFEIGDDTPVSPARNLFQREVIIPRRKRSTINRKPRRYPRWRIVQSNQWNQNPATLWRPSVDVEVTCKDEGRCTC